MQIRHLQIAAFDWALNTFGEKIATQLDERRLRFLEEALEFLQAVNLPKEHVAAMVEHVYSKPAGSKHDEAGDALLTLVVLCSALGVDVDEAARDCMERAYANQQKIRDKQMAKPLRGEGLK